MEERSAMVNGLIIDKESGNIRIGEGATGWFEIVLDNVEDGALDTDTDIVVFSADPKSVTNRVIIGNVNGFSVSKALGKDMDSFHKTFGISVNDDGKYCVEICLTNADTRKLCVGKYAWNCILVTDPEVDSSGNIVVDESDSVVPFYLSDERPTLTVEEVGYIV